MFDDTFWLTLIGIGFIVLGSTIIWAFSRSSAFSQSYLLPTLVVDALEPQLKEMYLKSLILDSSLSNNQKSDLHLGREFRRTIFDLQSFAFEYELEEKQLHDLRSILTSDLEHEEEVKRSFQRLKLFRKELTKKRSPRTPIEREMKI